MNFQEIPPVPETFEFTSGDHVVFVDSTDPTAVRVEISLRGLALDDLPHLGEALLLLHRLNATARLIHPWVASIDEDDMLLLAATAPAPDRPALMAILSEGIARAQALDALWATARDGKNAPAETLQVWTSTPNPLQFA